ncbi:hypothetical protein ES703_96041 [subsurface metagenome]
MKLNSYSTKDYENKPRLRTPGKQTQSNPTLSAVLSGEALAKTEALAKADSKWRKPCLTESGQVGLNKLFRSVFFCYVPIGLEVFVVQEDY